MASSRMSPFRLHALLLAGAVVGLGFLLPGEAALGQEELTIPELEDLYRSAEAGYQEAFGVLEVLTSRSDRAYQEFTAARLAGDEQAMDRAYESQMVLGPQLRQASDRVEEKARELSAALDRLLEAHARYLTELIAADSMATDPDSIRELGIFMRDTSRRIQELRDREDPPVTLPPLALVDAEPRDTPARLRQKAAFLERSVTQYESLFAYNQERLDAYRRDQALIRRAEDVLADNTRFGDLVLPVRTPARSGQADPPVAADTTGVAGAPLTLEERIEVLEAVQGDIEERIQTIRVRAENLRRLAGGEWAW
jgi:hypothetical protein